MLELERREAILDHLKANRSALVTELASLFFSSDATIRRDLDKLQRDGLVKRTHGGVVLVDGLSAEIPLYVRERENGDAKDRIGRAAAKMVKSGSILFLDSSSTTYAMLKYLGGVPDLSVVTNGAKSAITLGQLHHSNVFCTGGKLRENSLSYTGDIAKDVIRRFHANLMFFSCRGVSVENGLFESSIEEAELRKAMFDCCEKRVLLCDSTKFETYSLYSIGGWEPVDCLVTDAALEKGEVDALAEMGVEYVRAE